MLKASSKDTALPTATGTLNGGGSIDYVTQEELFDTRKKILIKLDPKTAHWEDIRLNAKYRQRLADSTIERYRRYAFNVMAQSQVPYNPMTPDYDQFIRHMDYREEYEHASHEALRHARDATQMFNYAFGIPKFEYRLPAMGPRKKMVIPLPDTVRQFWSYPYPTDTYSRRLYQYLYFFGFNVGVRPPNELVSLRLSDIIWNNNGSATITIIEPKKNYSERTIILPREIASSPQHKSLRNWVEKWRPETNEDLVFVREDGRPINIRSIGHELSRNGKLVWDHYHPYVMRHYCGISRLIEEKVQNGHFDIEPVMDWLGHEKPATTRTYVRNAPQYYDVARYSWLRRVLRFRPPNTGSGEVNAVTSIKRQKTGLSNPISPVGQSSPGQAHSIFQEKKRSTGRFLAVCWLVGYFAPA